MSQRFDAVSFRPFGHVKQIFPPFVRQLVPVVAVLPDIGVPPVPSPVLQTHTFGLQLVCPVEA